MLEPLCLKLDFQAVDFSLKSYEIQAVRWLVKCASGFHGLVRTSGQGTERLG
jgi:hypothetical protein